MSSQRQEMASHVNVLHEFRLAQDSAPEVPEQPSLLERFKTAAGRILNEYGPNHILDPFNK